MTIHVIVTGDIRIYRDGIVQELDKSSDIRALGRSPDDVGPILSSRGHRPDVAIVDMAVDRALEIISAIRRTASDIKVIALILSQHQEQVQACVDAGVAGFISRSESLEDLRQCIYAVNRGELRCAPEIAHLLLRRMAVPRSRPLARLTRRQAMILELLELGYSNKQIARALCIEVATVKNHVHHILEKLKVNTRGEAAAVFRRHYTSERTSAG